MITVLGMPVTLWFLFLIVIGIILCLHVTHKEGFVASPSGSYMTSLTPIYVQDCLPGSCTSIGTDTDRLTYFQRLYIGGKLISANGRYVLYYQPTGILLLNDLGSASSGSTRVLWSSNTRGTSSFTPSFLTNIGRVEAVATTGDTMPWIAQPNIDASGSGSGSASASGSGSGSRSTSKLPVPIVATSIPAITTSGIYLQVTDYGDLIVKNPAGSILWTANAGKPPTVTVTDACVPETMMYPYVTTDCYQIDGIIKSNKALIANLILGIACQAGYYCENMGTASSTQNPCPSGTYCPVNSTAPIDCPAGQYSQDAAEKCSPCPAGQSSSEGDSICSPCPARQSSIAGGLCTPCPGGQSSIAGGLCTPCPVGQSSITGGLCTNCPSGQSSIAGGLCTNCPAGQTSTISGATGTFCRPCPAGQSSTPGGLCTPCPVGQTSIAGGLCTLCPDGYYCAGGVAAAQCPAGSYSSGGSPCIYCPAGQYSANPGTASCTQCPAGLTSPIGSKGCPACASGWTDIGAKCRNTFVPGQWVSNGLNFTYVENIVTKFI